MPYQSSVSKVSNSPTERRGPLADAAAMGTDAAGELRSRAGPGFFET